MKKGKIISIIIMAVSVVLAIVSYIVLPDTVVVQISTSGEPSNTMPKLFSILLGTALSLGGAAAVFFGNDKSSDKLKAYVVAVVGIIVSVFTLVVNL